MGRSPSSQPNTRVVVTHIQHIDETNEEVQALLDAEVGTVEECIRAIEMYGTAETAIHHMDEPEEGDRAVIFLESSVSMLSEQHALPSGSIGYVIPLDRIEVLLCNNCRQLCSLDQS